MATEKLEKVEVVNLTEHPIKILESDCFMFDVKPRVKVIYPPSGVIIRARNHTRIIESYVDQFGIPIQVTQTQYELTQELPPRKPGIVYIVSKLIAELLLGTRDDLYVVSHKKYDKQGRVVGVRGLAKLNVGNYEREVF